MDVLAYSPSIEAYVRRERNGEVSYVDLTEDIVSARVSRNSDTNSTFSLTLQNKNWKYNGFFMPFDAIVIYATKLERYRLFSGYITDVDAFRLYQGDFNMSGKCTLYRIQQLYWDPGIVDSWNILAMQNSANKDWKGYEETIRTLLTEVGGWKDEAIFIGMIPDDVIRWAKDIYIAKQKDVEQSRAMLDDFYKMLSNAGPVSSGAIDISSGVVGAGGVVNSAAKSARPNGGSHADGADYHMGQVNDSCCGATSFTIGLNMLLGLKGDRAYSDSSVWSSSAFGCDSTQNLAGKGATFLANEGLSGKIDCYEVGIGTNEQLRAELQKGHVVCISSGDNARFIHNDGNIWMTDAGHFILFYNYSNGTYFADDPARSATGAGCAYSEADLAQWLNGRDWHGVAVLAVKGR